MELMHLRQLHPPRASRPRRASAERRASAAPLWWGLKFSHVGAILIGLVAPILASVKCDVQPSSRHSRAVGRMSYVVSALEKRTASATNTRRSFLCLLICCRIAAAQMAGYGVWPCLL